MEYIFITCSYLKLNLSKCLSLQRCNSDTSWRIKCLSLQRYNSDTSWRIKCLSLQRYNSDTSRRIKCLSLQPYNSDTSCRIKCLSLQPYNSDTSCRISEYVYKTKFRYIIESILTILCYILITCIICNQNFIFTIKLHVA